MYKTCHQHTVLASSYYSCWYRYYGIRNNNNSYRYLHYYNFNRYSENFACIQNILYSRRGIKNTLISHIVIIKYIYYLLIPDTLYESIMWKLLLFYGRYTKIIVGTKYKPSFFFVIFLFLINQLFLVYLQFIFG